MREGCVRWAMALALLLGASAGAEPGGKGSAEWLVRTPFYEGFPAEAVAALRPDDTAQLTALLDDPDELETHAAALEVLGMAGHPGAYEAISAYAAQLGPGELEPAAFRACLAVPIALGHLAAEDPRALRDLSKMARQPAVEAHYRHLARPALERLIAEMAIAGLGQSRSAAADGVLEGLVRDGVAPDHAASALRDRAARSPLP
ncbi:MAG: hypothetical protein AAF430_12700 [Myxococcota bacterium]